MMYLGKVLFMLMSQFGEDPPEILTWREIRCSELLVDDPSGGDEDKLRRHSVALIKFSSLPSDVCALVDMEFSIYIILGSW